MFARLRRAVQRDDGASAVEFALIMPLLLMLVFGIIAFGLVLFSLITAQHVAREAVRSASVGSFTTCESPGSTSDSDLAYFIDSRMGTAPTNIAMAPVPASATPEPGDRLELTYDVPTDEGAVGALFAVTKLIPGSGVLLPDSLSVAADARIEQVGAVVTCS